MIYGVIFNITQEIYSSGRQASHHVFRDCKGQGLRTKVWDCLWDFRLVCWSAAPCLWRAGSKLQHSVILRLSCGKGAMCQRLTLDAALQWLLTGEPQGQCGSHYKEASRERSISFRSYDHVLCDVPTGDLEPETPTLEMFPKILAQANTSNKPVISIQWPVRKLCCKNLAIMPASAEFTLLVAGIHDITGRPVVQWEDEIPDIQVARLRGCRDAAKSFPELYRNRRSQGVCHPFSRMETFGLVFTHSSQARLCQFCTKK